MYTDLTLSKLFGGKWVRDVFSTHLSHSILKQLVDLLDTNRMLDAAELKRRLVVVEAHTALIVVVAHDEIDHRTIERAVVPPGSDQIPRQRPSELVETFSKSQSGGHTFSRRNGVHGVQ
jgi:hypothetical protein